jgi:hypothetical protein
MGNIFEGYREGAQDWNVYSFDSSADLTPSGTGQAVLNYGVNIINFSGAVTAVLPSGIEQSTQYIWVKDGFGKAATANITISGAGNQLIDGAATSVISTNYGKTHLFSYSGNTWITL